MEYKMGKYGNDTEEEIRKDVCKPCKVGRYAPTTASTQCQECPPGSHIAQNTVYV